MSDKIIERTEVSLDDGKYTVVYEIKETPNGGRNTAFYALRYGRPWRDLLGDGMVLALVHRIEELEKEIEDVHDAACDDLREARLRG